MTMDSVSVEFRRAIDLARQALTQGKPLEARRWAEFAQRLEPTREEPWLILARLASPHASVEYLKTALELNPNSTRARQGMHWAIQRLRIQENSAIKEINQSSTNTEQHPTRQSRRRKSTSLPYRYGFLLLALFVIGIGIWFFYPPIIAAFGRSGVFVPNDVELVMPTLTPTFTDTPTATFTASPSATFTATSTLTPTATTTLTSTPTATFTPSSTSTFEPTYTPSVVPTATWTYTPTQTPTLTPPALPYGVSYDSKWISVSLSQQKLYAYEGTRLVGNFLISSGAADSPTLPGNYRIYAKNKSANMDSQDYDVPAVPYVLFYDKDFALHGAYWHDSFGTPVSHGCINLRIDDARWLYDWASTGLLVSIHQ